MDYKQVFELAETKGFELQYKNWYGIVDNSDIIGYLELCLIQKWLREEHNIHVTVDYYCERYYNAIKKAEKREKPGQNYYKRVGNTEEGYETYNEAHLEAIKEALKLI
jgi:hypothetical protein